MEYDVTLVLFNLLKLPLEVEKSLNLGAVHDSNLNYHHHFWAFLDFKTVKTPNDF